MSLLRNPFRRPVSRRKFGLEKQRYEAAKSFWDYFHSIWCFWQVPLIFTEDLHMLVSFELKAIDCMLIDNQLES